MNDEILSLWKDSIGSFAIVDYNYKGNPTTAKGKLVSVSDKGDVVVRHLHNNQTSWSFNIFEVEIINSKFAPLKGDDNNDEH